MILDGLATREDDGRLWVQFGDATRLPRGFSTKNVRIQRLESVRYFDVDEAKRRAVVARDARIDEGCFYVDVADESINVTPSGQSHVRVWLDEPAPPPRPPDPLTRAERADIELLDRLADSLERCQLIEPDRARKLLARIAQLAMKEN